MAFVRRSACIFDPLLYRCMLLMNLLLASKETTSRRGYRSWSQSWLCQCFSRHSTPCIDTSLEIHELLDSPECLEPLESLQSLKSLESLESL